MLHPILDGALDDLLSAWRCHEELRANFRTSLSQLAASRRRLDDARQRVHFLRSELYPNDTERESVAMLMVCATLEHVVHVPARELHVQPDGAAQFRCPCGDTVTGAAPDFLNSRNRESVDPRSADG